ncbi:kinase-like protein [Auriscalpium vulgare]|uniref:Kinase-like protein n=1 Tax=Auriscalpium vulgare TaxID=40419 RepID=A0ACB8RG91_9AGAM|nr:kinase-like protein [Auriscalpium vulgare]
MDPTFTFGGKYRLEEELAIGGCGTVFYGVHTVAGKEVAIKLEPLPPAHPRQPHRSPLQHESKIYKSLAGGPGVPWMIWSGRQGDYNVMVVDLMGPSLEDLFKMCNRSFSVRTVVLLADQLMARIEFMHRRDLVHRDIKPANFVMGTGAAAHTVNVIDFGLAKKYRDARTGAHIPYAQDDQHGVGTSLFASINTHLGIEASPRDDLESLAYMLVYFLRGTLPWRKLKATTTGATWDLIRDAKLQHAATLAQNLPREFGALYECARGMEYGEDVDWPAQRATLRALGARLGVVYPDGDEGDAWRGFDWMVGRRGERKGRVCEACRRKAEAEE